MIQFGRWKIKNFIADLHIHSRYSRATSKALSVAHLADWAAKKGINVLASGDFTHPAWRQELAENLVYDEDCGLYRLARPNQETSLANAPYFCLEAEISSIYKRGGKVRKIHNLVFMPDFASVEKLCKRLELIGNLNSDGRPILGLDSRDLLEIVLECGDEAVMIPAHIWTPWFSLFGSKSGFDSLEECYGDLSSHIFALETGLSSDPAMNRLLSKLDQYALVSNSDAHSGANLGREANMFFGSPSYAGIFAALRAQARRAPQDDLACRFLGTMEFYPEEGKYHLDGHRACNVSLDPSEAAALGDLCPVCGKPLTIGVLHRVLELADRADAPNLEREPEARMLIPLPEILAEIIGAAPGSKKVGECYERLLRDLGPELEILCEKDLAEIYKAYEPLGEAIARMRDGRVMRQAGFDGQFGVIRVFDEADLRQIRSGSESLLPGLGRKKEAAKQKPALSGLVQNVKADSQGPLFAWSCENLPRADSARQQFARSDEKLSTVASERPQFAVSYENLPRTDSAKPQFLWSDEQLVAMRAEGSPVFVAAGPGSGKTRVLVGRVLDLLARGVDPDAILAVTFTRRAAGEMLGRLKAATDKKLPACDTLHALAHAARSRRKDLPPFLLLAEEAAKNLFAKANPDRAKEELDALWREIMLAAENSTPLFGAAKEAQANYERAKSSLPDFEYLDYNDLLLWLLQNAGDLRFAHVLVDEIQDFSRLQLEIVRRLLPENGEGFFGIGDPDQAIYGFRGASGQSQASLTKIWPNLTVFRLGQSFRSCQAILDLAGRPLGNSGQCGKLRAVNSGAATLHLFEARDEKSEADWIARKIVGLIGATSHSLLDAGQSDKPAYAPGDIALLVRLRAQIPILARSLENAGIPYEAPGAENFWEDGACAAFLDYLGAKFAFIPGDDYGELVGADLTSAPEKILALLAKQGGVPEIGDGALFGESRSFRALCRLWRECGDWRTFFEKLAWLDEAELLAAKSEKVRIMTIHASKGLEFEAVFLPGLEDGLLPYDPAMLFAGKGRQSDIDEERRLLYVGITRAAKAVYCSFCKSRLLFGKRLKLLPSPFLKDMKDLMNCSRLARHVAISQQSLSLFGDLPPGPKKSRNDR